MNIAKRLERPTTSEIASQMADAVSYLSDVADQAGLDGISADLLSVRKKLLDASRGGSRRPEGRIARKTR